MLKFRVFRQILRNLLYMKIRTLMMARYHLEVDGKSGKTQTRLFV